MGSLVRTTGRKGRLCNLKNNIIKIRGTPLTL